MKAVSQLYALGAFVMSVTDTAPCHCLLVRCSSGHPEAVQKSAHDHRSPMPSGFVDGAKRRTRLPRIVVPAKKFRLSCLAALGYAPAPRFRLRP